MFRAFDPASYSMTDFDSLSEGELEDGEVLSSEEEEEGQGDTKVCKKKLCMLVPKPPFCL